MSNKIEFPRGDGNIMHTFAMPASAWSPGGTLFFAAKQVIDDDANDAAAVIKKSWGDSAVTDVTINGVAYKKYACTFTHNDTSGVQSNGADHADFLGEFQWVDASGRPYTFPPKPPKLDCVVYFDVVVEV